MPYEERLFRERKIVRVVCSHVVLLALAGCGESSSNEGSPTIRAATAQGGTAPSGGAGLSNGTENSAPTAGGSRGSEANNVARTGGAAAGGSRGGESNSVATGGVGTSASIGVVGVAGTSASIGVVRVAATSASAGAAEDIASGGASGGPPITDGTAPLVNGRDPANAALRAVATLQIAATKRCTGTLIRGSDNPSAPVYLLTAGWCVLDPMLRTNGTVVDGESELGIEASFGRFQDAEMAPTPALAARHIAYATLNGTDLALLKLESTRGELAALGVEPLSVDLSTVNVGDALRVVGSPRAYLGGSYERDDFLRESRCTKLASSDVAEHHFLWFDNTVSRCPGMGDGAEGAPVLNATGKVIAIHHRVYGAGIPNAPCFFGSPCEVGGGQPDRVERGRTYAVPLTPLNGCFAENGSFDVTREACHLEGSDSLQIRDKPSLLMAPGPNKVWGAEVASKTFTAIRIKMGPAADTNCRDATGYSNPVSLDTANLTFASLPLPETEGLYMLCAVAGSASAGASWQRSFEHPTVMVSRLYAPRPRLSGPQLIDLTPQQAFDIAEGVFHLFEAHTAANKARLTSTMHPDPTLTMDIRQDREWRVEIGLNLVQPGRTTPDVAAFLLCHETGHALGGFPFKGGPAQARQVEGLKEGHYATVSATEGQADYFATKECLPRLWAGETALNATFRSVATPFMKTQCDAVWTTTAEQDVCYRGAVTAEAVGRWYAPQESLRVDTPDKTVVPGLSDGRSNQCRVDTYFQGALCRTKFRGTTIPGLIEPYEQVLNISPAVEAAAAPDSCTEGVGSRPLCWFKPNAMPTDCSGIPEGGHCVVVDGQDAQQYCTERGGLETYPCGDGYKCEVDEIGLPNCMPK